MTFGHGLNNFFDIAHVNAIIIVKINKYKEFLTLQRQHGDSGCILGLDLYLDAL